MRNYTLQVIEAAEPLDLLDELKTHLQLNNGTAEDTKLERLLATAVSLFERHSGGYILSPTTFRQSFPYWHSFELARGLVTSVEAVEYYSADNTLTTLEAYNPTTNPAGWQADLTGTPALVYLPEGPTPAVTARRPRPIAIEFVAGVTDPEYLPADIVVALFELVRFFYDSPEADTYQLPQGFLWVADNYKTGMSGL